MKCKPIPLLLALLVALFGLPARAESQPEPFIFRNGVTWNIDMEQVLSLEGNPEYEEKWFNSGMTRVIQIHGVSAAGVDDVTLEYCFMGDTLLQAGYDFTGTEIDFDTLSRALTQVYGEPEIEDRELLSRLNECVWGQPVEGEYQLANWHTPDGTYISLIDIIGMLLLDYTDQPSALAADLFPPEGVLGLGRDEAMAALDYVRWSGSDSGAAFLLHYEDWNEHTIGPYPTLVFLDNRLVMLVRELGGEESPIDRENLTARFTERYGEPIDPDPDRLTAALAALGEDYVPEDIPAEEAFHMNWEDDSGVFVAITNRFDPDGLQLVFTSEAAFPEPTPEPLNVDGL